VWLDSDWVLGQFGGTRGKAQEAYRRFIREGIKEKDSPWKHLTGQIYLGGEAFCLRMQRAIRAGKDQEIPKSQMRPVRPSAKMLLERIAVVYGVRSKELVELWQHQMHWQSC